MFADSMDIVSVLRWRATCRTNYASASSSLRRTLLDRLHPFIPYPQRLIDIVDTNRAVFGGELALSFIMRTDPYQPIVMEIYSSHMAYEKICDAILEEPSIRTRIDRQTFSTNTLFHALQRLVAASLTIHLSSGLSIYVHQSYTGSPCAPITRAPCTALSNFVTPRSFGCSHPMLTFERRGLLADKELPFFSPSDWATLDRLLAHKFSVAVSPAAWPEFQQIFEGGLLWGPEECWREKFVCPNQGRFFGDQGSLVGFFDPLGGDEGHCMEKNVAPFGPMVIWRMMSTFDCDDGCEYLDDVLESGVTCIPVLIGRDPSGELRDCISDRTTRTAPLYRYSRGGQVRNGHV